jgi:hypothetical protein
MSELERHGQDISPNDPRKDLRQKLSVYTVYLLQGIEVSRVANQPWLENALKGVDLTQTRAEDLRKRIDQSLATSSSPLHGHGGTAKAPKVNQLAAIVEYIETEKGSRKIEIPFGLLKDTTDLIAQKAKEDIEAQQKKIQGRGFVGRALHPMDPTDLKNLKDQLEDTQTLRDYIVDQLAPKTEI